MQLFTPNFKINFKKDQFYSKYNDPDNSYFENEKLNTIKEKSKFKRKLKILFSALKAWRFSNFQFLNFLKN